MQEYVFQRVGWHAVRKEIEFGACALQIACGFAGCFLDTAPPDNVAQYGLHNLTLRPGGRRGNRSMP